MTDTTCKHRWEQTAFGRKYLNEGTVIYMCRRCNEGRLVSLKPTQKGQDELLKK